MSRAQSLVVDDGDDGIRLDRWFKRHFPELSHGRLERLLRTGQIRVAGGRAKSGRRVRAGETVRVPPLGQLQDPKSKSPRGPGPGPRPADVEALLESVLHSDDDLVALNKPPGLAVQGGSGIRRHVDAMLDALAIRGGGRPRLVHRLDKDTSGLLLIARSAAAAAKLTAAFRDKRARKIYWAVVCGAPSPREGRIDLPLEKQAGRDGEKVVAAKGGKGAVTDFSTVETAGGKAAWLALDPLTGRTHQLRVHCAHLGTPVVGDGKYGGAGAFLDSAEIAGRLHLHARAIRIPHPAGGMIELVAPLPPHMRDTWRFLGFDEAAEADPFARFEE